MKETENLVNAFDPDSTGVEAMFFGVDPTEEDEVTAYHDETKTEASEVLCLSCHHYFVTEDDDIIVCPRCGSVDVNSCEE